MAKNRTGIIVALDISYYNDTTIKLIKDLAPFVDLFKVGLETMTAEDQAGVSIATKISKNCPKPVMWDGKFLDIQNTMEAALRNVAENKPKVGMLTLHATASKGSLAAAARFQQQSGILPLAVTVLTDLDETECKSIFGDVPDQTVLRLTERVRSCGMSGLVCSPNELTYLRGKGPLDAMMSVTPGVRPAGASAGDQKRVMTPGEAARAGARYIVVGRPIMEASDPVAAAVAIRQELDQAVA